MSSRLHRSYLFAPGDNEHLLGKVLAAGADAAVLDLEDAVRHERKDAARKLVAELLRTKVESRVPVYVRINPVGGSFWQDDVVAVVQPGLEGVRLAKAESAAQIAELDHALSAAEVRAGMTEGTVRIVPTIESALGVTASAAIAQGPRVDAICFGMADFLSDIRAEDDDSMTPALYALSQVVLASRAAGIKPPVASVHRKLDDPEGLRTTSTIYRRLGFFGRSCIHPRQVPVVHEVFTPSEDEVARARALVHELSRSQRGAAVAGGGEFVDEAVVKRAREVIALAESLNTAKGER